MDTKDIGVFSVWSEGELVGKTRLDYLANTSQVKFGDFTATEYGERVIAIRMAVRKALIARATYQEIEALQACRDAAPLELRSTEGHSIPTDDIEITDLEWLNSLAPLEPPEEGWEDDLRWSEMELGQELQPETMVVEELSELIPASLLEQDEEPWPAQDEFSGDPEPNETADDFARYQIQVRITGGG